MKTTAKRAGAQIQEAPAAAVIPPLPKEEGREGGLGFGEPPEIEGLWVEYKRTEDPGLRNRLIERYYPLVRYISERLLSTLPRSIELDDLTSAGLFGLMDAIDGFDLSRGIKFKTAARPAEGEPHRPGLEGAGGADRARADR